MADISGSLRAWSTTASNNAPGGSTAVGTGLDDNLREIQKVVRQYLAAQGTNMASAATVDLATADGFFVTITGTTTITALGTEAAGIHYMLLFAGALTLTHNATSLILPGGASIVTTAGDIAWAKSEGSGNWRIINYSRAIYLPGTHGADIASAATVNLDAATGDLVDVTGTTTITAITLADGRQVTVRFTGVLQLTHGASLVLPNAQNIQTGAGDFMVFRGYAAGVVRAVTLAQGAFRSVQVFTASGTYTKPAGLKRALVKVQAPGGGGGGADTDTGGGGGLKAGGGGGAGGYSEELLEASAIAATETVTIGAVGTAGSATNGTDGVAGGTTSFGTLLQATGGAPGTGTGLDSTGGTKVFMGGAGGVGSNGTINTWGGGGTAGLAVNSATNPAAIGGAGGNSVFGSGARSNASTVDATGAVGNTYGGGGAGGVAVTDAGGAGGAGGPGIIIVYEYY